MGLTQRFGGLSWTSARPSSLRIAPSKAALGGESSTQCSSTTRPLCCIRHLLAALASPPLRGYHPGAYLANASMTGLPVMSAGSVNPRTKAAVADVSRVETGAVIA